MPHSHRNTSTPLKKGPPLLVSVTGTIRTGGRTRTDASPYSFAGGGGGGFQGGRGAEEEAMGGGEEQPKQSAGGGGGSACGDGTLACDIEAGGNKGRNGFVTFAVYRCF